MKSLDDLRNWNKEVEEIWSFFNDGSSNGLGNRSRAAHKEDKLKHDMKAFALQGKNGVSWWILINYSTQTYFFIERTFTFGGETQRSVFRIIYLVHLFLLLFKRLSLHIEIFLKICIFLLKRKNIWVELWYIS